MPKASDADEVARPAVPVARTADQNRADILHRRREAVEFTRRTELQSERVEARRRELASQVSRELELAAERIRAAETRALLAESRAATAEARAAQIQDWLDSVYDLVADD